MEVDWNKWDNEEIEVDYRKILYDKLYKKHIKRYRIIQIGNMFYIQKKLLGNWFYDNTKNNDETFDIFVIITSIIIHFLITFSLFYLIYQLINLFIGISFSLIFFITITYYMIKSVKRSNFHEYEKDSFNNYQTAVNTIREFIDKKIQKELNLKFNSKHYID